MLFGLFKKKPPKSAQQGAKKAEVEQELVGDVIHYFGHCKAAVMKLVKPLSKGDVIHIKGHTTDFTQKITSMQVDGKPIDSAGKGQEIGLQVKSRVRSTDKVYRV